jgi:surface antigen
MHRIYMAVLAATLAAPAFALNINVFKDAPVTRLNAEEVKAFRAFVIKTLNEGADGASAEWKAPKTTFTSKVTPMKTFQDGKLKCRDATIDSDSHDRQMRGTYTFCKGDKGDWQFKISDKKGK